MQIGEFAVLCKTKISVLRHYDKAGVLSPDYIDRFTGYRYYSEEQAVAFFEITSLKAAGFSLSEIKEIMSQKRSEEELLKFFDKKKSSLREALESLSEAKKLVLGKGEIPKIEVCEKDGISVARYRCAQPCELDDACDALDRALLAGGYQRISFFESQKEQCEVYVWCNVVKLSENMESIYEDEDVEFCNDPDVVGKWQVVGEYPVFEDFFFKKKSSVQSPYKSLPVICFLPEGEEYWCYSWSLGKLIIKSGGGERRINDYTVTEYGGERYMIVDLKSYNYKRGGKTTVLVLRQLDNAPHEKDEFARYDDTDMPYVADLRVMGLWRSCAFVYDKKDFSPERKNTGELFWQTLRLCEDGEVHSSFSNKSVISSRNMQEWTKGYILRKWTKSALSYELRRISGAEYLFVEWKSGDYIYGGMDTNYYVFERAE